MSDEEHARDGRFPDEEPEVYPRVFGNYLLLHRLARGGMGEVYLAKTGGLAGIEKHCVVKTLRPHFTSDREYVTRFIDEARVVVGLTHRNIAQTFDVGRVGHQYYLAMEYIPGMDVRSVQDRFQERRGGQNLDESVSLHMICEVLEALDYAHRAKNPQTGKLLHLVHRDISPQNLMVNFEGEVKLIDFGLAQSTTKEEQTQPHMVMGKMAYMSPEQARGEPIDATADQFAVAVVLYELLVGERYYGQMNPEQIWAVAGRGDWLPPRLSALPRDLARLLKRALDPDPRRRYPTCGDFREDLVSYQYAHDMRAGAREIRALMHELYAVEQDQHEALVAHYAGVHLSDFLPDELSLTSSGRVSAPPGIAREEPVSFLEGAQAQGALTASSGRGSGETARAGQLPTQKTESTGETRRVARAPGDERRRSLLPFAAVGFLVVLLVVGVVIGLSQGADRPRGGDELIITEVLATAPVVIASEPEAVKEPAAVDEAPPAEKPPPAAAASVDEGERAERRPPRAPPRRSRTAKKRLPDSVLAQNPKLPIQKIAFLKKHCLERVSCAARLTDLDKIAPDELDRLNKSGRFDQCIRRCKE